MCPLIPHVYLVLSWKLVFYLTVALIIQALYLNTNLSTQSAINLSLMTSTFQKSWVSKEGVGYVVENVERAVEANFLVECVFKPYVTEIFVPAKYDKEHSEYYDIVHCIN